jgi:hypothetical protein
MTKRSLCEGSSGCIRYSSFTCPGAQGLLGLLGAGLNSEEDEARSTPTQRSHFTCLTSHSMPSVSPLPVLAEHGWICQGRSRMEKRFIPSATSLAGSALMRSCLFASTSSGTPAILSSASRCDSSSPVSTHTQPPAQKPSYSTRLMSTTVATARALRRVMRCSTHAADVNATLDTLVDWMRSRADGRQLLPVLTGAGGA